MGKRHVQILMLFVAGFIGYGMRSNLSIGIVAMMDKESPGPGIPTYPNWTNKDTILSSFFWGYVIFQVCAGRVAERYGPKYFLIFAMTIASCFSILIPHMAAKFDSIGVIVDRVIQGLCQGFLFPSTHCVLSKWTPLSERSRIAGFVYTAGPLGTSVSMVLTGMISDSTYGWPYAFYLYGCFGLVWAVCFTLVGCNEPSQHPTISAEERQYIEETTKRSVKKASDPTPWRSFATSLPVWAVLVAHVGNNWGFWTLFTEIPSYMSKVLHYNMTDNSRLSAAPYLGYCLFSLFLGTISDAIISRNILSIGTCRKFFNSIGLLCPAVCLILLGYVSKDQLFLADLLLILAVTFNGAVLVGFNVNHIDISPNYAGTLMGLTNCAANIASILGPLAVQYIVTDQYDEALWRLVFLITAAIYVITAVFFVTFGSGEVQEWNEAPPAVKEDDEKPKVYA